LVRLFILNWKWSTWIISAASITHIYPTIYWAFSWIGMVEKWGIVCNWCLIAWVKIWYCLVGKFFFGKRLWAVWFLGVAPNFGNFRCYSWILIWSAFQANCDLKAFSDIPKSWYGEGVYWRHFKVYTLTVGSLAVLVIQSAFVYWAFTSWTREEFIQSD
jgi:hypothetical protein